MGSTCGFLALMTGLCVGADAAYTKQEPFDLDILIRDAEHLKQKILYSGVKLGLILRSDKANDNYTTDFLHKLYSEKGKGVYSCSQSTIGHVQMGGHLSPFDRILATLAGLRVGEWLAHHIPDFIQPDGQVYSTLPMSKVVLCCRRTLFNMKSVAFLSAEANFMHKVPTHMWWLKLRPLLRILAMHYEEDYTVDVGVSGSRESRPSEDTQSL